MKYILNPFTPIPASERSHVRGWAMAWAQRLNAKILTKDFSEIKPGDYIFIDHGVNFSGSLNLFGGFNDEVTEKVISFIDIAKQCDVYSLDHNIRELTYIDQIRKRFDAPTTSKKLTENIIGELETIFSKTETVNMRELWSRFTTTDVDRLIIGDSHSTSYSMSDQAIDRTNGKLLFTTMKNVSELNFGAFKDVTFCLGSIDIRFHCIPKMNEYGPKEFAQMYVKRINDLKAIHWLDNVSVCTPVPIEHEERKLPKTGQYKGVNFNGSREQRLQYTKDFINYLKDSHINIISPPSEWYDMDGEVYAKEIMEMGGSVHIAPVNYNSIINWNKNV